MDYILAPPPTLDEEAKSASAEEPESQILFCIDISGSMCVSQQIDGKHSHFKLKGNHLNKDHDDLSQFIDGNANHLNRATDIQYVSRLQCVQTAVDEQVEAISKSHPHYKLGLVTFNNEVTVIGDGVSAQVTVAGDKLNDLDKLKEIGTQCKVEKTIGECREKLSKALWSLKETGQTALGPALAVSVAMASSKPGSQVNAYPIFEFGIQSICHWKVTGNVDIFSFGIQSISHWNLTGNDTKISVHTLSKSHF